MKRLLILFFSVGMVFVSLEVIAANPTTDYLKDLQSGRSFIRAADGVVTDSSTKLQWRISNEEIGNWYDAEKWIKSLGNGWRTPTLDELRAIYSPGEKATHCLDKTFKAHEANTAWADTRDSKSVWTFNFNLGKPSAYYHVWGNMGGVYAFAVRSRK
ncbi:MAG: DUF1566 domain-containing protein [Candidatus Ozemobacteraceae bacterium]